MLTDRECQILDFEGKWWKHEGAKVAAVLREFGASSVRYYLILNAIIDKPAASAHAPLVTKRLLRQRADRQRARLARRLGLA